MFDEQSKQSLRILKCKLINSDIFQKYSNYTPCFSGGLLNVQLSWLYSEVCDYGIEIFIMFMPLTVIL